MHDLADLISRCGTAPDVCEVTGSHTRQVAVKSSRSQITARHFATAYFVSHALELPAGWVTCSSSTVQRSSRCDPMGLNVTDDVAKNPAGRLPSPLAASSSGIFQLDNALPRRACGVQSPEFIPVSRLLQPPWFTDSRAGASGCVLAVGARRPGGPLVLIHTCG